MENKEIVEKIKNEELSVALNEADGKIIAKNLNQMKAIGDIIASALVEGIDNDYSIIPNCGTKKRLLQPGADKIILLFGLNIEYELIEKEKTSQGWVVLVKATLRTKDGSFVSNSFGAVDPTNNARDKGKNFDTTFKIAQKRAKVWAVKSIGGLSDTFVDDIGDFAIKSIDCITNGKANDLYKVMFELGIAKDKIKGNMSIVINNWNKDKRPITQVTELKKVEYDEFKKFMTEFVKGE